MVFGSSKGASGKFYLLVGTVQRAPVSEETVWLGKREKDSPASSAGWIPSLYLWSLQDCSPSGDSSTGSQVGQGFGAHIVKS